MRKYTTNEERTISRDAIIAGCIGWCAAVTGCVIVLDPADALVAVTLLTVATIGLILAEVL